MRLAILEPLRVDALRVDALRTDAYVESLIAGTRAPAPAQRPADAPDAADSPDALAAPDPAVAAVARLLHATAARPHPSFRFEERVAARLTAAARGARTDSAGALIAFPGTTAAVAGEDGHAPPHAGRSVAPIAGIASAAVASAALSLVAAAVVAWRRGRPRRGIA